MNVSEAIEKIKVMLADNAVVQTEEIAPEPATQLVFETYDLKDGSKIDLSALEIGADAMLVDESGNSVAAPDGEYEMADGTMMTVVEGKVEAIETPQAEETSKDETPKEKEMENESQFDEMNATITYLQAENEALKNKLGELESKFNQGFSEMLSVLEGFSKTPVADPIQNPKNNFRIVEPKADKIERFLERVKTLN
jgi:hypothetical protein